MTAVTVIVYKKASFVKRALAFLIDSVLISIPMVFAHFVLYENKLVSALISPLFTFYFVIMESTSLQATIGKRMLNLKVIKVNGQKPDIMTSLARNVGKVLVKLTYGHGILQLLAPHERQTVQDKFANCLVVEWKKQYKTTKLKSI
jgi:uncharacterized RDD family membrane protein YckC